MKIKKAVIPVAGKGTRFLPATKEIPKEMIPILTTPMIHHVVSEAVRAGIKEIIFVISSGKNAIEDYFDRNLDLEAFLEKAGKTDLLDMVKSIGTMINVVSVRQKEQLGLGHAILCAESVVGNEDFAVLLGDDLVLSGVPVTRQLTDVYEKHGTSVIGVMEVDPQATSKYGIVSGKFLPDDKKTLKMDGMVEKPHPSKAPTRLATPGRYILTHDIFDALKKIPRGAGGEYQLTDAIHLLAGQGRAMAHIFDGERFDTGTLSGYLDATLEFALRDPNHKQMMLELIREKHKKYGAGE